MISLISQIFEKIYDHVFLKTFQFCRVQYPLQGVEGVGAKINTLFSDWFAIFVGSVRWPVVCRRL